MVLLPAERRFDTRTLTEIFDGPPGPEAYLPNPGGAGAVVFWWDGSPEPFRTLALAHRDPERDDDLEESSKANFFAAINSVKMIGWAHSTPGSFGKAKRRNSHGTDFREA